MPEASGAGAEPSGGRQSHQKQQSSLPLPPKWIGLHMLPEGAGGEWWALELSGELWSRVVWRRS